MLLVIEKVDLMATSIRLFFFSFSFFCFFYVVSQLVSASYESSITEG